MTATTQFPQDQLTGKSLAEIEAWTPEFLAMVLGFIERGAIVSYVPLWSETRQAVPVHLSFYPIHGEGDVVESLSRHSSFLTRSPPASRAATSPASFPRDPRPLFGQP